MDFCNEIFQLNVWLKFLLKMKILSYVGYIWYQREQHGQPVQDLGGGQGVYQLCQDHDEVAGMNWTKLKFEQNFERIDIILIFDETVL